MQQELDFNSKPEPEGLQRWRAEREAWHREFARANGIPLGHKCRVILRNDMELVGILRLAQNNLPLEPGRNPNLELQIDRCTFTAREIASVARID
jgi:hypothetical protein